MEAQNIECVVGFQVMQREEQLFVEGIKASVDAAFRQLFDFTALVPFLLDSVIGALKSRA
jgi:hypothetical protein